MTITNLRRLEQRFTLDKKITADEAKQLIDSTADRGGVTAAERAEIAALIKRNADRLDPSAKTMLEQFAAAVNITPPPPGPVTPPANSEVIRTVTGASKGSFTDDTVFLGRDGTMHGEANVPAYTRSYDSTKEGPLRFRHGSTVPASSVVPQADLDAAKARTPGQALDAAAKVFGAPVNGFEAMANSKDFFNKDADYWWGKCHAWTWSSLSNTVNKLVDVPGPEGQKGLWVGGEFVSRADLGNWMMAVSDTIALQDPNQMFKGDLSALDLLKGTTQFLMNNGGGMVSDVFNDKKKGHKEVWNQPFVSSDTTTTTISGDVASKLLDVAKADNLPITGATVKQVTIVGTYGVETGDDHEGEGARSSKTWNLYAVCDPNGKVVGAYMADDEKLKNVTGLPTSYTDDLPDYIWKPTLGAIDDTLAGKSNSSVDWNEHGKEFKFFVGTVLSKGVPATTRTAFENDFKALPAGAVGADAAKALAQKYPGVANAYSPTQWKAAFSARGLDAKQFGATWPG